jgi:Tfp pilus assembly pilus retraction ATPase PilT
MQMIDLLRKLIELKGSDLHLMAGLHPAVRVHGELTPMTEYPRFSPEALKDLIYSILSEDHKRSFESDRETARPFIHDKSSHETLRMYQRPAARPAQGVASQARPASDVPPWEKK